MSTELPAKLCKLEDFGHPINKETESHFKDWDGYTMLCPDFPVGFDFKLEGEPSMTKS